MHDVMPPVNETRLWFLCIYYDAVSWCLFSILPAHRDRCHTLRLRGHDCHLPNSTHNLHKLSLLLTDYLLFLVRWFAFSELTLLLVGRQEEHPACKNWVMRCSCGYLSGLRCRFFAYGPADATASQNPTISCPIYIQTGFTFLVLYRLTQVVLEKKLLNG